MRHPRIAAGIAIIWQAIETSARDTEGAFMGGYTSGKGINLTARKNWPRSEMVLSFYPPNWARAKIIQAILNSGQEGIARADLVKICPQRVKHKHSREAYLTYALLYIAKNEGKHEPRVHLDLGNPERVRFVPLESSGGRVTAYHQEESAEASTIEAVRRKYGARGEGDAHKQLKLSIARNGASVGISEIKECQIEKEFISGDRADLVFTHADGTCTVVEVETDNPLPGAHQLIKYRALLCAEKGLPLHSDKVRAKLVAWDIPDDVRDFCQQYGLSSTKRRL